MGYPDTYGQAEHRRALDTLLTDMFTDRGAPAPLPIQKFRAAGGVPGAPPRANAGGVIGGRVVAGFCEVSLLLEGLPTGQAAGSALKRG
ncbi:MAG: hypothetical protein IT431_04705 [Phycisphaerales bacterium]|nr:hypothetical protein [Phycisphaerales bacterium]